MRDKDKEVCECGNVLRNWNGAEMWNYRLITHGSVYKTKITNKIQSFWRIYIQKLFLLQKNVMIINERKT